MNKIKNTMELLEVKNIVLTPPEAKPFLADAYYQSGTDKKPLVIFVHGYKGFKDWGAWSLVAKSFAEAGFYFVKFNFSHNGTTLDNPLEFDDLEAFGANTYSQEQRDLNYVVDYFKKKEEVDASRIYLIGHSRGGGAVVLNAYYNQAVTGVISWAGVSNFNKRFPQRMRFDEWKKTGVYYSSNGRTKQEMPHYFSFYEDYLEHEDALNIQYATQNLSKPALIVHGTTDEAVPMKEAALLHEWIKKSELFFLDTNHVFGAKHPWNEEKLPHDLNKVVQHTIAFIKRN